MLLQVITINYGIIAVNENQEIIHFVGYENPPTEIDIEHLYDELKTDEELGCIGIEFNLFNAPREYVDYIIEQFFLI